MTPGRRPDHDLALQEFYKPYLQRVRAEAILPWGHRICDLSCSTT